MVVKQNKLSTLEVVNVIKQTVHIGNSECHQSFRYLPLQVGHSIRQACTGMCVQNASVQIPNVICIGSLQDSEQKPWKFNVQR